MPYEMPPQVPKNPDFELKTIDKYQTLNFLYAELDVQTSIANSLFEKSKSAKTNEEIQGFRELLTESLEKIKNLKIQAEMMKGVNLPEDKLLKEDQIQQYGKLIKDIANEIKIIEEYLK